MRAEGVAGEGSRVTGPWMLLQVLAPPPGSSGDRGASVRGWRKGAILHQVSFLLILKTGKMTRAITTLSVVKRRFDGMSTNKFYNVRPVLLQDLQHEGVEGDGERPVASTLQHLCWYSAARFPPVDPGSAHH